MVKCIDMKSLAFRVPLLIWILSVIILVAIHPVKAETGSITIINNVNKIWNPTSGTGGNIQYGAFQVDLYDYNKIDYITLTANTGVTLQFAQNFESTRFTCNVNCSGGGWFYYDKNASNAKIVFDSSDTFTIAPAAETYLNVTYDKPQVPLNVSVSAGCVINNCGNSAQPSGVDYPFYISDSLGIGHHSTAFKYDVHMIQSTTDNYAVSYLFFNNSQNFILNLTKGGTVPDKYFIQSSTGTYTSESTYNTNPFQQFISPYGAGLVLNGTLSGGGYTRVVVNSTGCLVPGCVIGATPAPTPIPTSTPFSPAGVNSIFASQLTYLNNQSVNIYGSFYPATTTKTDCLFFGYFCTSTTINTESTTGYVFISTQGSTSPSKFISFSPDSSNNYNLSFSSDIGNFTAQLFGFAAPGATCTNGVIYDFPFIPLGCYYPHNITSYNVANATPGLYVHWNTNKPNTSAYYGDTVSVSWQSTSPNDIITIYDNNHNVQQTLSVGTLNQMAVFLPLYTQGTWNATISNTTASKSAGLNVLAPGAISVNNTYGISMYWEKAADSINTPTKLDWNTGTYTGNYTILIKDVNYNTIKSLNFSAVPGQNQQSSFAFSKTGTYTAQFVTPDGNLQAQADILINQKSVVATPTPTTPTSQQATNAASALTSTVILSIIITAGLMIAVAWRSEKSLPTAIIGMASLGGFTYISWFPAWIFFSVLVVMALLLAKEIVESQTKNVTR